MAQRVTEKQLEAIVDRINKDTGSPGMSYTKDKDGNMKACIGNYHISHAYGGVCLHRMSNEHGGVSDVFRCGHVPKRELADRMWAFLDGLYAAKQVK